MRQETASWLEAENYTVFGTLKLNHGADIHELKAEGIVLNFFNRLDRLYLGKTLVENGHRIARAVFRHKGVSGENLHYHFLATPGSDPERFCKLAKCNWEQASTFTIGSETTQIEVVKNAGATSQYCTHEFSKLGSDTLFLPACQLAKPCPDVDPSYKERRLSKFENKNGLL